jgi:AcrR family transcriptional regulator
MAKRSLAITTNDGVAAAPRRTGRGGAVATPVAPVVELADPGEDGEVSHNLNGQRLGRKGRDTRERILLAAGRLLYCDTDRAPISLSAVAREASLGMTSLYNYFTDLTEVLLAVLEPVMASAEDVYLGALRKRWDDRELSERCYEFVSNYQAFWQKHSRLLHLRNAMSDQHDPRMTRQRIKSTQPIIGLLVEQMDGDPKAPRSIEFAMATVLMIGIERATTISTDDELPIRMAQDIRHDEAHFVRPSARLMEMAIRDMRSR